MDRDRLLRTLITVAALVLAVLPAVVVFGRGWLTFGHPDVPAGVPTPPDTTSPMAWAFFALFYLGWLLALMVLTIFLFDRVGHHWRAWDRAPRREKRRRRRLHAGMDFLAGQQKAQADAEAELARRRARLEENRRRGAGSGHGARPSHSTRRHEDR